MTRRIRCRVGAHLEYSDKRLAASAAGFPVAYDSSKRLAVSAVEFPVVLANLEAKLDALYGQFERLASANERLTDVMLGRVADLEKPDLVEVLKARRNCGIMLDESS